MKTFYEAWWFLHEHPSFKEKMGVYKGENHMYTGFLRSLDVYVAKINPKTREIDEDDKKNTEVEVWLECGEWQPWDEIGVEGVKDEYPYGAHTHDYALDTGGATYEEAIINLAALVEDEYGTYNE